LPPINASYVASIAIREGSSHFVAESPLQRPAARTAVAEASLEI
jgi:hypothetical protein